jgi:hypothetical protein
LLFFPAGTPVPGSHWKEAMNALTPTRRPRAAAVLALVVVALIASVVGVGSSVETAEAATVRSGARWDQIDVLFTRSETVSIATGLVGGVAACKWLTVGLTAIGAKLGGVLGAVLAAFVTGALCVTAVTTCAAKANLKGRSAGMTISPAWFGVRWWCWDY